MNRQSLANLSPTLGNILFDGETSFSDSFEVWADGQPGPLRPGVVTFLDDQNHALDGFDGTDDVVWGGAGKDGLNGLGGSDELRGGAGDDTLSGGADGDILDLGSGVDTVRDTVGDLNGDVISSFGRFDALDITGSRLDRSAFTFDHTDGQIRVEVGASTFTLEGNFSQGEFMAVSRGIGPDAHTVVTFQPLLPALGEGVRVDPSKINGVANELFLTGDGATQFNVEFRSGVSAFSNSLGYYTVGADGTIDDVLILFSNTRNVAAGTQTVDLGPVGEGEHLAFFLIQDGFDRYGNLPDNLTFRMPGGATPADIDAGIPPVLHSATLGDLGGAAVFHSIATLNQGDMIQVLSGTSRGGLDLLMGFEDLPSTTGDNDFQDVVIRIWTEDLLAA